MFGKTIKGCVYLQSQYERRVVWKWDWNGSLGARLKKIKTFKIFEKRFGSLKFNLTFATAYRYRETLVRTIEKFIWNLKYKQKK